MVGLARDLSSGFRKECAKRARKGAHVLVLDQANGSDTLFSREGVRAFDCKAFRRRHPSADHPTITLLSDLQRSLRTA